MATLPILQVALPVPLPHLFDYLAPQDGPAALPGTRVQVPFGRRNIVGVVVGMASGSDVPEGRLLPVSRVLDNGEPLLDSKLIELLRWCWKYYKHAPGDVIASALPPALRQAKGVVPGPPLQYRLTAAGIDRLALPAGRARVQHRMLEALSAGPLHEPALEGIGSQWRKTLAMLLEQGFAQSEPAPPARPEIAPGPVLLPDQNEAVRAISAGLGSFGCHLLDGVTGSGKTEVYMSLIERVLSAGRQALVLVPEIGLTPQLLRRFRSRLGLEPAVIHSGLSAGERLEAWATARSGRAALVIGTRSALFTPMPRPGLIILDEEHDASFKQQDGFRYSARDIAVKRALELDIPIVLGSATPSLESFSNAVGGRYSWHRLRERATRAPLPSWRVLDLRQQSTFFGLTAIALDSIEETLGRGEQVIVFLNRRGYAPVLDVPAMRLAWQLRSLRCPPHLAPEYRPPVLPPLRQPAACPQVVPGLPRRCADRRRGRNPAVGGVARKTLSRLPGAALRPRSDQQERRDG